MHSLGRAGLETGYLYVAPDEVEGLPARLSAGPAPPPARRSPEPVEAGIRMSTEAALARLVGATIGVIGKHPDRFDTCRFDADAVLRRTGIHIERLALDGLLERARAVTESDVEARRRAVLGSLDGAAALDQDALPQSCRLHAALEGLADDGKEALAVRCWPEMFTEFGAAACGPMAMLSDRRIPAACEADVHGAITSLLLQELAGSDSFLVDIVDMDTASDTSVVWHCGLAPRSMADPEQPIDATIHSNRRLPLLRQFGLKPGRVTVARLSEAKGRPCMVVATGEMPRAPRPFSGTSGTLRLDRPSAEVRDRLLTAGIEHHVSLLYADGTEPLEAVAATWRLPVLKLT